MTFKSQHLNKQGQMLAGTSFKNENLGNANFMDADLTGADLTGARLTGALFRGANLTRVKYDYMHMHEHHLKNLQQIAEILQNPVNRLNMCNWHTCETVHCLAGWADYLYGKVEDDCMSVYDIGLKYLGIEAASHFFDDEEITMQWLNQYVSKPGK